MISLLIVERFCKENSITHLEIDDFLTYMWRWPEIDGPDKFDPWESSYPSLVAFGLGGEMSESLRNTLEVAGVSDLRFRAIISGAVEILWGSFWAAADDEGSFKCLEEVVLRSKVSVLPPLTPFRFSRVSDRGGWGDRPSAEDRIFWEAQRGYP
ncbi:hypothetical protein C7S18_06110 [Ahniella affigens]|uniref:Uncharacterized protein n=1 Tax=Ahniella affigens TaxID=2021234 RepID=A0A2P1PPN1_9GAMM|nr:hypothetical protein [Ahniella affigens]AVP96799.1 hypothetical protein C7S18_06110 [Ahniella affigens]